MLHRVQVRHLELEVQGKTSISSFRCSLSFSSLAVALRTQKRNPSVLPNGINTTRALPLLESARIVITTENQIEYLSDGKQTLLSSNLCPMLLLVLSRLRMGEQHMDQAANTPHSTFLSYGSIDATQAAHRRSSARQALTLW